MDTTNANSQSQGPFIIFNKLVSRPDTVGTDFLENKTAWTAGVK